MLITLLVILLFLILKSFLPKKCTNCKFRGHSADDQYGEVCWYWFRHPNTLKQLWRPELKKVRNPDNRCKLYKRKILPMVKY